MFDERAVIREIKAGNTSSYALLVERYHKPLLAYIFKIVGDKDLVEDIGQEVFFTVYRSLKTFDETKGVPFSAWIFTAAKNHSISALRKRRTGSQRGLDELEFLEDGRENPEEHLLVQEQIIAVNASLQQIPEPFRNTLSMSLEGSSLEKIATIQEVTVGTVKSRLFRAKERMRLLISAYFEMK